MTTDAPARRISRPIGFGARPLAAERGDRRVGRGGGGEHHHAETAVEGAQHFRFADAAGLGEPGEDRRRREGGEIELDRQVVRQHARQVVGKAAAGDMGERQHAVGRLQRREQRLDVEPRRLEQRGGERCDPARTAPARPRRGR